MNDATFEVIRQALENWTPPAPEPATGPVADIARKLLNLPEGATHEDIIDACARARPLLALGHRIARGQGPISRELAGKVMSGRLSFKEALQEQSSTKAAEELPTGLTAQEIAHCRARGYDPKAWAASKALVLGQTPAKGR